MQILNAPGEDADIYPPEKINDLKLKMSVDETSGDQVLAVAFTSPGDDFYEGTGKKKCLNDTSSGVISPIVSCFSQRPLTRFASPPARRISWIGSTCRIS